MSNVRSKDKKNTNNGTANVIKILTGSIIGAVTMIIMFFAASSLILNKDIKGTLITVLAFICCGLSGIIAGFVAVKRIKISGLIYGLLSGLPLCLLLLILTLSIGGTLGTNFVFGALTILIASAIGGILAVNIKRKPKY